MMIESMSIGKQSQNPDILETLARICMFSMLAHAPLNCMASRSNLESKYSQFEFQICIKLQCVIVLNSSESQTSNS